MKVEWSVEAQTDLEELRDYIARDSPYYAEQFIDRLLESVATLIQHPKIGRSVPEAKKRDDVREIVFHGYRIIYLLEPTRIVVLTVVHGSRDLRRLKPWSRA